MSITNRPRYATLLALAGLVLLSLVIGIGTSVSAQEGDCVRVGIAEPFTELSNLDPYVRVQGSGDVMYIVNNAYERLLDLGDDFTLVLSAGSRAGVERLSAVVSADGLVGSDGHVKAAAVPTFDLPILGWDQRAGAHKAHLAPQDIEKLRHLVELPLADHGADAGDPGVSLDLEEPGRC